MMLTVILVRGGESRQLAERQEGENRRDSK
jgi:hypothetical protein